MTFMDTYKESSPSLLELDIEEIEKLKKSPEDLANLIRQYSANGRLLSILKRLGRLPQGFNGNVFLPLLHHPNHQVRLLAVKNIGKLCNIKYLKKVSELVFNDTDSMVRREAVSSIGRMKSEKTIPILKQILKNSDPKIVLQAIRGLLVFKSDSEIQKTLLELSSHPNEIIQGVILSEFNSRKTSHSSDVKHIESPGFMKNTLVHGEVKEVLKMVPDESVHLTFTSPPYYNARDYSIYQSYKEYLLFLAHVFKEVLRITKEGRFFVLNTSPIIIPRVSRKHSSRRYPIPFDIHPYLVEMGWEFIDDIVWSKPEASAKNRNAGFLQHRKPLGYKANSTTEYLMVYRKRTNKLIDWNMKQYSEDIINKSKVSGDYESSNIWKIDPVFDKVHSAVFPEELCRRVILFYSYIDDLVFDPFGGSGTFSKVAMKTNRYFFSTEIEEKYVKQVRIQLNSTGLFSKKTAHVISIEEFKKECQASRRDNDNN